MKYALVTGGSRGIGRSVCIKLAEMGYSVLINYKSNLKEAENTLQSIVDKGGNGTIIQFDVADKASVDEAISNWQKSNPESYIEVLVNNAGINRDMLMLWMSVADWQDVLDVSLNGAFNAIQPILKDMMAKRFGRIINIVSLSGIKGQAGQVNYSAAKGGVIALTKALSGECARKGVTVNAVAPGFIHTEMTQNLPEQELVKLIPMRRFGEPEEVAELVGFLASKNSSYITGEVISINGGIYT